MEETYQNYISNIIIEAFFNYDDDDDDRIETRYAVNNLPSWILFAVSIFQTVFELLKSLELKLTLLSSF